MGSLNEQDDLHSLNEQDDLHSFARTQHTTVTTTKSRNGYEIVRGGLMDGQTLKSHQGNNILFHDLHKPSS